MRRKTGRALGAEESRAVRRVARGLCERPWRLSALLLLDAGVVASGLALPVLTGAAVDRAASPTGCDLAGMARVLAVMAAVVVAGAACQWAQQRLGNRIAYGCVEGLRERAFDALQGMPLAQVDALGHGELANRIGTDAEQLAQGLVMALQQLPVAALGVVATLAVMFALDPLVGLAVAVLTPVAVLSARWVATRSARHFSGQTRLRGELASLAQEGVSQLQLVAGHGAQGEVLARFRGLDARLGEASLRAVFFSSLVNPTTRFASSVVYAAIGVLGALAAIAGQMSVGTLAAFLGYADQYAKPFNDVSGIATELAGAAACAARLLALADAEQEPADEPGVAELREPRGDLRLEHVAFSYPGGEPVLRDVSLEARAGQTVALVGRTGCGKTTLVGLVMRFFEPDRGRILVDGRDMRGLTLESVRGAWGMVLQESWLRRASVRDNVAMGRPDATDEEVRQACHEACADEFVSRLPHGYDTVLDESTCLSAGQRQLLCIARAILARPRMLILDEATSDIDTRTEALVQRALGNLMRGRTCLVVAHRLSTVRDADAICVIEGGRVAQCGTHEELLAQDGPYREIFEAQFRDA